MIYEPLDAMFVQAAIGDQGAKYSCNKSQTNQQRTIFEINFTKKSMTGLKLSLLIHISLWASLSFWVNARRVA
jgi:hypothetical protein